MSADVVTIERGIHVHDFGTEWAAMYQETSPGRCWLCAYWPEPPPQFVVTAVDREAGIITLTSLR